MPLAQSASIENNFTAGLKTDFTGLNFPENAATDCDNVVFDVSGDVTRRLGFDYEVNYQLNGINRTGKAITTYVWKNVGGDGTTQMLVQQVGNYLHFYKISDATVSDPISKQKLVTVIDFSPFKVVGSPDDPSIVDCEYADGNGYLFVYNPHCETFYVSLQDGELTPRTIVIKTRDFTGFQETEAIDVRPTNITQQHLYNLQNQGWTQGNSWSASSNSSQYAGGLGPVLTLGTMSWTVQAGITGVTVGQTVRGRLDNTIDSRFNALFTGVVISYSGTTLTLNVNSISYGAGVRVPLVTIVGGIYVHPQTVYFAPLNIGYINTFKTSQTVYPSNADVWWRFKDSSGAFNPSVTAPNVSLNTGQAPQGHFILEEFSQGRASLGAVSVSNTETLKRPRTGTWFAGRIWYTGVDDLKQRSVNSDATSYNWSENIYFSQIITTVSDFGNCYQTNDPTAEDLFNLLPSDGGVITIQGCGKIYKLFPIQNGMLIFCQNGIWFVTGSQGIGFTANDYTITKISSVQSISSSSFVNVLGLPYFWNEEGIYTVSPTQQGLGLTVTPVTVGNIQAFYDSIPATSKQYARGDYDPINYILTFIYRGTPESNVTDRYEFDRCLNFNTYLKSFYPYTISSGVKINSIDYVNYPNAITAPDPCFKYLVSVPSGESFEFTFAEERDEDYIDFESSGDASNYTSYFVTGYKIRGQAQRRFQTGYVYVYSRNEEDTAYRIQSRWDYANSGDSGRWSSLQLIENIKPNFGMVIRRHKLRGQGLVCQIYVKSVDGMPFDIMGWSIYETSNAGV